MATPDFPLGLVTGAAHRLGKIFALALARHGYAVLLHYHTSSKAAEQTAREIEAMGVPVRVAQSDLSRPGEINKLFSLLDSLPFRLKVLVNSAALMRKKDLHNVTIEDWNAVLDLNLRAPFLLAQKAAERMKDGGLIVNITDVGAHKLWTGYPAYAVSKSALETLTRLQAKTYAPHIRVNAIAPGLVLQSENVTPEEWQTLVKRLPLQRPASSDDIASALEFLLKNESVTGQTITVDGGYSLV
jgi:NAD(P)-dependent dehydrogenase (short-subunit alcohol dehydrogenase family)